MLDIKTYSRQELIDLFKTERIDSIKNKLQRQGYKFTTSGRGKELTLTITEQPLLPLRTFAIEELGFSPQTDFDRLEIFLYRFYHIESKCQAQLVCRSISLRRRSIIRFSRRDM